MRNKFLLFIAICALGLSVACNPDTVLSNDDSSDSNDSSASQTEQASDYDWNSTSAETITLNTTSISTTSANVTISGTTATITKAGSYILSGNLTNGQLIVKTDTGIVKIMLNGATMANSSTSPFYIKSASKAIIFLADGSTNSVSDASTYANSDEPNASLFSNTYLAFTGTGSLTVKGNYNDAISSDDQIIINNGNITVTAKDDGIRGKDYLKVNGGTIKATAGTGHALKSDNSTDAGYGYVEVNGGNLTLSSTSADGIHAKKRVIINDGKLSISAPASQGLRSDSLVVVNGGTTTITASNEGVESPIITFNGGTTDITASDDGLNATYGNGSESNDNSLLLIAGGYLAISAKTGDGLDSNGNIKMTGGTAIVHGPSSQPEVGIDYNGTFNISGGLLMVSGPNSGNMIQTTSTSSSQYTIKITSSSIGTNLIHIEDASGTDLITFKPIRSAYYLVFSSSGLKSGSSYSIYTGGTYTGGTTINGYSTEGTYSGGTLKKTFTVSGIVTSVSF